MTAYFDDNQDLWIEVTAAKIPKDVKISGIVHQQSLQNYQPGSFYSHPGMSYQSPITYMNLTKYIHEQTLLKIIKKLDDENV
jgi:hypothetical protein